MHVFCELKDLNSESDVEQKIIVPILTSPRPIGMGFNTSDYKTKVNIKQLLINKGASSKLYYPDYVIIMFGLPVAIIEAKKPGENLDEALREARLYAHEINSSFGHGLNPCQNILAINGDAIAYSAWDSNEAELYIEHIQIDASDSEYGKLIEVFNKTVLEKRAYDSIKSLRGVKKFVKPVALLGGRTVQNEELPQNTFGSNLSLEFRGIFNPDTEQERAEVVKNAYVGSKKRQKHVDPINKIIRAASTPSLIGATKIEHLDEPKEIIQSFKTKKYLSGQLMLLIGSVGSGKSTFVDYLKEVALPEEIKLSTNWVSLNLNNAPLSREFIYDWVKKGIVDALRDAHYSIDFDSIETLLKIHSDEIKKLQKGPASILGIESEAYKIALFNKLNYLQENLDETVKALVKYLCNDKGKFLIVVLDNCDRRNREDQLLMFEIANWLKVFLNCLVFLPLRDTTFDNHRKEKPLDTVIKDLVYRIDPPSLMQVLYKRISYALYQMKSEGKVMSYVLGNNMKVEYYSSELGNYLASIMTSLFQNSFFQSVITGVAGRDIRKGLETFLDFCKSGHIDEREMYKMIQSGGKHEMPYQIISKVVFRGNRRFYNDSYSLVKNLFASYTEDPMPNPFTRLAILQWLKGHHKKNGPNGVQGYHKISALISNLIPYGHSEVRIKSEVNFLIINRCIITESQGLDHESEEELISIGPGGIIHLELASNIDYIAACAEDVWFNEPGVAEEISQYITGKRGMAHYAKSTSIDISRLLIEYLERYEKIFPANAKSFINIPENDNYGSIEVSKLAVDSMVGNDSFYSNVKLMEGEYNSEDIVEAVIASIQKYGAFVKFGIYGAGLIHISQFSARGELGLSAFEDLEVGDWVKVKILQYNKVHKRFDIDMVSWERES